MIATTLVQSRHLLELGLDPKTADMFWKYSASLGNTDINGKIAVSYHDNLFVGKYDGAIPAWSLTALLEVMPKENEPELVKSIASGQYFVHGYFDLKKPTYMTKDYDSPIDAAYEMVCWLLEQGLIKKGDNNEQ